jgi:branched-chain amino acid transport system ATP-binding protein
MTAAEVVLRTEHLVKRFGGLKATDDVSLDVFRGARHALIGPNGAGKSTLINQLTGVLAPTSGRVELEGRDITRLPAHERVARGLVRTFQISQLFGTLTPLEALSLAVTQRGGGGAAPWRPLGRDRAVARRCEGLLDAYHLADVGDRPTALLPYGKRRLLEIALAIACAPRVLLLDEPAAGVPEAERHEIFESLARLPVDVSVVLIEHDMDLVFNFATRVTVMVNGAVFADGDVASIATDPRVKAVYLGQGSEAR